MGRLSAACLWSFRRLARVRGGRAPATLQPRLLDVVQAVGTSAPVQVASWFDCGERPHRPVCHLRRVLARARIRCRHVFDESSREALWRRVDTPLQPRPGHHDLGRSLAYGVRDAFARRALPRGPAGARAYPRLVERRTHSIAALLLAGTRGTSGYFQLSTRSFSSPSFSSFRSEGAGRSLPHRGRWSRSQR